MGPGPVQDHFWGQVAVDVMTQSIAKSSGRNKAKISIKSIGRCAICKVVGWPQDGRSSGVCYDGWCGPVHDARPLSDDATTPQRAAFHAAD